MYTALLICPESHPHNWRVGGDSHLCPVCGEGMVEATEQDGVILITREVIELANAVVSPGMPDTEKTQPLEEVNGG